VKRFLFDTVVFVYAVGGPHPYREPCRAIVEAQVAGAVAGEAAADLIREYADQRFRQTRDRALAARSARRVAGICRLHGANDADILRALDLYEQHPGMGTTDAGFAAVALNRGIDAILTSDRHFDGIPGLERIDPLDAEAVAALGS
jgi:predicted nucleic acid-binding protein